MFEQKHLSKLIIIIPIIFIILTASLITFIHVKNADLKFKHDSLKLKEKFLKEEELRLKTIVESVNSYIKFKKATSTNILKNEIKSKVDFTQSLLDELQNNNTNSNSLQINLLTSLVKKKSSKNGKYFIYSYKNKSNKLIRVNVSEKQLQNDIYSNREFLNKFNTLLKDKNEGYIFYHDNKDDELDNENSAKLAYVKNFPNLNLVIGYSLYIKEFEKLTRNEVKNRLNLMKVDNNTNIFTLDEKLNYIQNSQNKMLIGKSFNFTFIDEDNLDLLNDYIKKSKVDLEKNEYLNIWEEHDKNSFKLYVFNYISTWNQVVVLSIEVNNINNSIKEIIGENKKKRDELIFESIQIALFFMVLVSFISYFISSKINFIFSKHKLKIESQKNALRNINATLEIKVQEKTKQLEILNNKLEEKFLDEVNKNRKKDQILYSQSKMAAMGEMIGNIAHQWRQPLSTISTIASGNSLKLDFSEVKNEDLKKDFTKIIETSKHLSSTIEDFREFFKENKKVEIIELSELLEKNLSLVSASYQYLYITVIKNFNKVEISGIKNELTQALLNILNNAKDALENKEENKRFISIDLYSDENFATIIIKDSAGGIKEEHLNKIFDESFTTKKAKGTGIGLYMTKQIIQDHMNGKIEVCNEEFVYEEEIYFGACFKLSFPINKNNEWKH